MKTKFITILSIIAILLIVLIGIKYPDIRANKIVIISVAVLVLFPIAVYFINRNTKTDEEVDVVFEKLAGEQDNKALTITGVKVNHKDDKNESEVEVKLKDGSISKYNAPSYFPVDKELNDRFNVLISSSSFTGRIMSIRNKVKLLNNDFTPYSTGHSEYGYVYCFYRNNEMLLSDVKKVLVDYLGFQPICVDGKIVKYALELDISNKKINKYNVATEFETTRQIIVSVWFEIFSKIKTLPEFYVSMPMSPENNELFLSVLTKEKLTMEEFVKLPSDKMLAIIKKVVNSNKFVNELHVTLETDVNEICLPEEQWFDFDSNEYFNSLIGLIFDAERKATKPNVYFLYKNKNDEVVYHQVEIKNFLISHRD